MQTGKLITTLYKVIVSHPYRNKGNLLRTLLSKFWKYSKCPIILYTYLSHKMAYANGADPDQTAPEGKSDQGLHCLHFNQVFCETNFGRKSMALSVELESVYHTFLQ